MWVNVIGFEKEYLINEDGIIKSIPRPGTSGGIVKQQMSRTGYKIVCLSKNGKKYTKEIHRLLYYSFYPNSNPNMQVNHKDENPLNNTLSNLELLTQKENLNYGTRNIRISNTNSKEDSVFQNIQSKKVICYKYPSMEYIKEYKSTKAVEQDLGVHHSHVSKCCKGIYKQISGYTFRYA